MKDILLKLQLFQAMKIYNVFYLDLLWKTSIYLLISHVNKSILSIIIDNEEEWEVEDICDAKSY